ncbi:glycosyl hydrolase family 61-domain-containing protein [Xylaria telfairii]|nr:glycosyl hydrolase family 61-domain-containing protein [Xylaria telfairii]
MKCAAASLLAFAAFISYGSAHYVFPHLVINDTVSEQWQYVRDVLDQSGEISPGYQAGKTPPLYFDTANFRCGRAIENWTTETALVDAGDKMAFRVSKWDYRNTSNDGIIFHPGPAQVYMSRAPDDKLDSYKGDGEWFKIAYYGPMNDSLWTYGEDSAYWNKYINFTVPKTTPPGHYLIRVEQFMPYSKWLSEWFVNCAQVKVVGKGGGTPGPLVKFPEAYKATDPGIDIPPSFLTRPRSGLSQYIPPGPPIWQG